MHDNASLPGLMARGDAPCWVPLESAIGSVLAGWFMWMSEVQLADRHRVQAYKHATTRHYLHLGEHGEAFEYHGRDHGYLEVALATAILRAFAGWERAGPPESQRRLLTAAINEARRRAS
ncbi:MAG: hypothetical protein JO130_16165 [Solirubrobacterales bacterium]|nr:hypothetical protein [Solirubrobacterales bacterium]